MCTISFDGDFEHLEGRWKEVLGWSEEELRSRPLLDFIHPEDRAATLAHSAASPTDMAWLSLRNRWRNKGGGWSWLIWSAVAVAAKGSSSARSARPTARSRSRRRWSCAAR